MNFMASRAFFACGSKLPRDKAQASLRTPKAALECGRLLRLRLPRFCDRRRSEKRSELKCHYVPDRSGFGSCATLENCGESGGFGLD